MARTPRLKASGRAAQNARVHKHKAHAPHVNRLAKPAAHGPVKKLEPQSK